MKDAPPASTQGPYPCGEGERDFTTRTDSQNFNQHGECTECYARTLQVLIMKEKNRENEMMMKYFRCVQRIHLENHRRERQNLALWFV